MKILTIFAYLAFSDPWALLELERRELLVIMDHLPKGTVWFLRHGGYKRIKRRIRQVKWA